jgi:chromosome segregation ATPase
MKEIKPNVAFLFMLMASAVLSAGNLLAEEAAAAPDGKKIEPLAEKAAGTPEGAPKEFTTRAQIDAAKKAAELKDAPAVDPEMEAYRKRLMDMRGPRDKEMTALNEIKTKIEARRKAVFAENEDAGKLNAEMEKLNAEITEATKTLGEKDAVLTKMLEADAEFAALQKELSDANIGFRASQRGMRDEIAKQHRERLMKMEKQKLEAEAAAKAKAAEGAAPAEPTGVETDKAETK